MKIFLGFNMLFFGFFFGVGNSLALFLILSDLENSKDLLIPSIISTFISLIFLLGAYFFNKSNFSNKIFLVLFLYGSVAGFIAQIALGYTTFYADYILK